jgi:hypothetical protein
LRWKTLLQLFLPFFLDTCFMYWHLLVLFISCMREWYLLPSNCLQLTCVFYFGLCFGHGLYTNLCCYPMYIDNLNHNRWFSWCCTFILYASVHVNFVFYCDFCTSIYILHYSYHLHSTLQLPFTFYITVTV